MKKLPPEKRNENADDSYALHSAKKVASSLSSPTLTFRYSQTQELPHADSISEAEENLNEWLLPYGRILTDRKIYPFRFLYSLLYELNRGTYPLRRPRPQKAEDLLLPVCVSAHGFLFTAALALRLLTRGGRNIDLDIEYGNEEIRLFFTSGLLPYELLPGQELWEFLKRTAQRFSLEILPVAGEERHGICFALPRSRSEAVRFLAPDCSLYEYFFHLAEHFF